MTTPNARRRPVLRTQTLAFLEACESRRLLAAYIAGKAGSYATIQAAVDAAVDGQTINVDAGTYSEQVFITKSLTLRGAKAGVDARTRATTGETILNGIVASNARTNSFYVGADNVTLDGFTVQGETSQSTTRGAGIVIAPGVSGSKVLNNIVQNNVAGLFLSNASPTNAALVQQNLFQNNNNAGVNGGRGIYTDGEISGGNITNVTIDSNAFKTNYGSTGTTSLEAAVAFEAHSAGKQSDIRITNNSFAGNGKATLFFHTTGVLIQGNSVTTCRDWYSGSLRFEGDNRDVRILYNTIFSNTGPGVAVDSNGAEGDNSGFIVSRNNIYGNGTTSGGKLGVVFNQSVYVGAFDATNNYWGAASGPSGDGPGTGDSVYGNASKANAWSYAKGGIETFSPFATATINTAALPAPTAPSGLTATAASASQVNLAWTPPTNVGATQSIQRSTDGVNFTTIATVSSLISTYANTGLSTGVTYSYRVVASNAAGTSTSNVASSKGVQYQPPQAPTALRVTATAATSVTLAWSVPAYNVGIAKYTIYRNGVAVGSATGTTFTDTGLTASTAYAYAVATVDTTGATSSTSGTVSATTTAVPTWRQVSLAGTYNRVGIVKDGTKFSAGFDGGTAALSSNLLGATRTWNGSTYALGAANASDVISAAGQTIALPQSNATTLGLLAAAVNGNQLSQSFVIRYTDGSTQTITQSISDWATAAKYAGESAAVAMNYRNLSTGSKQTTAVKVFGYSFALDSTKQVASVTLPKNANVNVLAINVYGTAPAAPAAPQSLAAAALSSTQIRVSWSAAGSPTSFTLQRSTDGVNFTPVSAAISGTATSYTDSGLTAGTTYSYRLYAVNAYGTSAASPMATATTVGSSAISTPLGSLAWTSATSGWNSAQVNATIAGNTISLRGTTYATGIGTHASSTIVYNVAGKYTRFLSDVGVDDEVNGKGTGSVDFQVIGDGKVLFDSGVVTNASGVVSVSVDLTGVKTLTLVANSVNGDIDFAHADWAGARLLSNAAAPDAPASLAAGATSTSQIALSWSAPAGTVTGYKLERSLDNGTTWAPLVSLGGTVLSYNDTGLAAGTTYTYRVSATNAVGDSAPSSIAVATTFVANAASTNLSSLDWTSATTGYGTIHKDASISGNPITLGGQTYASGIGTHAPSTITYALNGAYSSFVSDIGIDDEEAGKPVDAVTFQVWGDGKLLFDSGSMAGGQVRSVSVSVAGVTTLSLVVTSVVSGAIDYAHGDWAGARLLSAAPTAATTLKKTV